MRIERYEKDYVMTPDDFVLGTDGNNLNKTKNFPIWQLSQILLGQIKNSGLVLRYSDGSDPALPVGSNGYFFTKNNVADKPSVTEFYFSKTTLFGEDVAALLNSVKDNLGELYIALTQVDDASNYGYFNILDIEQVGEYYKITTSVRGSLYAKQFKTEQNYSVLFDLATNEYRFAFENNKLNLYKNEVLVGSESLTINVPTQSRITSGTYQGNGIVRFTRNDSSFFDVDQSGMLAGLLVTKTSQLQNDGDGTNPFLTDAYKTIVDGKVANLQSQITNNTTEISVLKGVKLTIDQIQQKIFLKDGNNNELANISVAFLNNEGVKFKYDNLGKTLQLLDDQGNVLDSIPVSSFVSNIGTTLRFNSVSPAKLELVGNNGDAISEVTIQISNVAGLQAALDGKEPIIAVKNSAFNKDFGTTAGTVMEGNDQRVLEGAIAFTYGDHRLEQYLKEADIEDIRIFMQNWQNENSVIAFNAGHIAGYTYQVSATWIFDGQVFSTTKVLTLTDSDNTNDRIDLIALTFDGDIIFITGTAAENPVRPEIDFDTQLEGTFILVQANTVEPVDINTMIVYNEGTETEWSPSISRGGARWELVSTTDPSSGILCVEGTDLASKDSVQFNARTPIFLKDLTQLNFQIKNKKDLSADTSATFRWTIFGKRSDGTYTSLNLPPLVSYGYSKSNLNYQFISLPVSQTSSLIEVTSIRLTNECKSATKASIFLDDVKFLKLQETTNPNLEFATTEYVDRKTLETYNLLKLYADSTFEPYLNKPSQDGYLLSSTAAGVRSWIPAPAGGGGSTYSVFTRTVDGLVPAPTGATLNRYLREDGTWGIPPDTTYTHPNKSWVNKTNLTGNWVISNLTIDALGHLEDWVTRQITAQDIGAEPALGNPTQNDYILSSKADGTRSWIPAPNNVTYGTTAGTAAEGNDSRIINGETAFQRKVNSVSVTGDENKVLTLTLQDGSVLQANFTDIAGVADGDEYVNSLNFSTANGVLTVGRTGSLTDITVSLDGRYLMSVPAEYATKAQCDTYYAAINHNHDTQYSPIGHNHDTQYSASGHNHNGTYEPVLGNPSANGYILSSTTGGVRSWIPAPEGGGGGGASVPLPKPSKTVTGSTYTFALGDQDKWLRFTHATPVVTVPENIFAADDVIEGEFEGNSTITFQGGGALVLRTGLDYVPTMPKNGVFGIKFKTTSNCLLFGGLNPTWAI